MKNSAERTKLIMQRAEKLRLKRENRQLTALKVSSAFLACMLFVCIGAFSGPYKSAEVTGHYGAIMLIDGMGGYVLTAVTAFAAATVITALCIKKRK